ncbi:MAG: glycosyltransferase family 2 protein [Sphingomonas sp.]
MPDLVLVTVTYNATGVWDAFMASLLAQRDADWHLVVIDNQSRDGTVEMLKAIDDSRVSVILNDGNLGVAAANNQGIRAGLDQGARRIMLINNDVEFGPALLSRLDAEMSRAGADAISPLIPYFDAPDRIWYGGGSFTRWARGIMPSHDHAGEPLSSVGQATFHTDYTPTCCVLFDRTVFERIGLMTSAISSIGTIPISSGA